MMMANKLKAKIFCIIADQEGAALVEFALLLPVLLIFFMAALEFGIIIKEWRRLNDLVEAQVLYLSASNGSYPPNSTQFLATSTASTQTIIDAVSQSNSGINSSDATVITTKFGCACASNSGQNATITFSDTYTLSTCPSPPIVCGSNNSYWHIYADVAATKNHAAKFFGRWLPKMTAHALVRLY